MLRKKMCLITQHENTEMLFWSVFHGPMAKCNIHTADAIFEKGSNILHPTITNEALWCCRDTPGSFRKEHACF